MQQPPSESGSPSVGRRPALPRPLITRATDPRVLGALAVAFMLLAIATDAAASAGSIPFLLLCYAHARRARKVSR